MVTVLVMDGQCQDEFLHCTDPGLEQERIIVTFRWIPQHAAFQRVRSIHLLLLRVVLGLVHFGHSGSSLESCAYGRCWLCLCFPSCLQDSGHGGVPIAGHVQWAEVGRGILCVTLGEFTGLHQNAPIVVFRVVGVIPWM